MVRLSRRLRSWWRDEPARSSSRQNLMLLRLDPEPKSVEVRPMMSLAPITSQFRTASLTSKPAIADARDGDQHWLAWKAAPGVIFRRRVAGATASAFLRRNVVDGRLDDLSSTPLDLVRMTSSDIGHGAAPPFKPALPYQALLMH
jgi:hypothetical protein